MERQATADWLVPQVEMRGEGNVGASGVELVITCDSSCQPLIISVCKEPVELALFLQDDLVAFGWRGEFIVN